MKSPIRGSLNQEFASLRMFQGRFRPRPELHPGSNPTFRLLSTPCAMLCLIEARIHACVSITAERKQMASRLKLNERTVRDAPNPGRDYQIFDSDVRGFSLTIYPSGNRTFTLDYRTGGRQRRMAVHRPGILPLGFEQQGFRRESCVHDDCPFSET